MIVESLLTIVKNILVSVFSMFHMPEVNENFYSAFNLVDTWLTQAQSLIDLFLPWDIVKYGIPIIIVILNIDHIYNFILWLLRKIPVLNIK